MRDMRCGTYAGSRLHARLREPSCDPCKLARRAYAAELRGRPRTRRLPSTPAADRFWPKVDKTETCWEWTAAKKENGYGAFFDGERLQIAHRFSFELANGPVAAGMQVDHMCHNRACVNPAHMRTVTPKQNVENTLAIRSDNTSGYKGIVWDKARAAWMARVTHHGRTYFAGYFSTRETAAVAAAAKRNELFTHNDADRNLA